MTSLHEEEKFGPTIDAPTQEERIQARRDRIAARIAAAELDPNKDVIEAPKEKSPLDSFPHKSAQQLEASKAYLDTLREKGSEKVTLVRITADMAECKRRDAEDAARRERMAALEAERNQSLGATAVVASQWSKVGSLHLAEDLQELLNQQKKACDEVIQSKDTIISKFQLELKGKDDDYVKDLRTQAVDVNTLLEFMAEQTGTMTAQYKQQLEDMEKTFMDERNEFIAAARKEWNDRMKQRRDLEELLSNQAVSRTSSHTESLENLQNNSSEEYAVLKIKLETEIQNLEQQLQNMRATYQLNSEKLEYNFQVLKKRDEENAVTMTSQKRRIARLQDVLANLKKKVDKQDKALSDENESLSEDFKRINQQYNDLQKKFRQFQNLDQKKYEDMWEMAKEQCTELAAKVLDADKALHEQQLGLVWKPPTEDIYDERFDYGGLSNRSAGGMASDYANPSDTDASNNHSNAAAASALTAMPSAGSLAPATVKRALNLLCDEAGFLVESKLEKLLSPLEKKAQSLMKLDSIFKVLGVETEEDVFRLASYFVKPGESKTPELIHVNDVNVALRRFVEDYRKLKGLDKEEPLVSTKELFIKFWDRIGSVLPKDHERVWKALEEGMEKYVALLEERAKVIDEAQALEQQNAELRGLLQQYINSQVTNDLAVPPFSKVQMAGFKQPKQQIQPQQQRPAE